MERDKVMRKVVGIREEYVAEGRLEKARDILRDDTAWEALELARALLVVCEEACAEE